MRRWRQVVEPESRVHDKAQTLVLGLAVERRNLGMLGTVETSVDLVPECVVTVPVHILRVLRYVRARAVDLVELRREVMVVVAEGVSLVIPSKLHLHVLRDLVGVVAREADVGGFPVQEIVEDVGARRVIGSEPEDRLGGIERRVRLPHREGVFLEVVECNAIPADPVGQEVVRLDLVIRARAQAVVPRAVEGIVLVAEPRRVRQVEPVRILILLPLVLVEGASQLERLERRGLDGDLANAGPGLAGVRGQHAVLEETRLRRIGHVGGEDAGPPVLDVLALPGEVEVDLLHAGRERASQRCVEVLVPAASTLEFAEDSLRRSEVLVASVLGDDIDGARLHAPVFRVESARLDHDLLDRVVVDRRRGDARQRILLRKSVDVVGDLVRSSAADDQRVVVLSFIVDVQLEVHDAGLLGHRVLVSAQRLVFDVVSGEELGGARHVLLDQRALPPDDHFRHVRQHGRLHVEIELRAEVGDDLDVLPHHRHIPQERDPYGVLAGRHVQDDVVPLSVRHRAAFQVGNRDARDRDGLSRLGVVHDARELPRGARPGRSGKENGARHDDGCA